MASGRKEMESALQPRRKEMESTLQSRRKEIREKYRRQNRPLDTVQSDIYHLMYEME